MQDLYFNKQASAVFDQYDEDVMQELTSLPRTLSHEIQLHPKDDVEGLLLTSPQGNCEQLLTSSQENLNSDGEAEEISSNSDEALEDILNNQGRPQSVVDLSETIREALKVSFLYYSLDQLLIWCF